MKNEGSLSLQSIMKKNCLSLILLLLLAACSDGKYPQSESKDCGTQEKGNQLLSDSMKIAGDRLNDFYFSVRLLTTGIRGNYEVQAAYGPQEGNGRMVMPRGGESLCPELRRLPEAMSYEVGFRQGSDTTYYPYFLITWQQGAILMRYTAAYSFE